MSIDSAVCGRQRKVAFEIVQVIELLCPQSRFEMRHRVRLCSRSPQFCLSLTAGAH